MTTIKLSPEERKLLLEIARAAIEKRVFREPLPPIDDSILTDNLREEGASFVTLSLDGALRGCIGSLEPYQALAEDVREHAIAAAFNDFRFSPITSEELPRIKIEISRLTKPVLVSYQDAEDLVAKLRPGIDGVVLQDGLRRATFLPQVWDKLPDPQDFLSQLCLKMGIPGDSWLKKDLEVFVYQVEEFRES
jgi:AmmeMemoRadiSam system protein A